MSRNMLITVLSLTILMSRSLYAAPYKDDEYHRITSDMHFKSMTTANQNNEKENDKNFWLNKGKSFLQEKLNVVPNTKVAKNIIFFLGDGMSIPTLAASRIYLGQQSEKPGEETVLSFEEFPYVGLSKTYCVDSQVADSACTSTAYLTGVKGNIKTAGVTAAVKLGDCKAMNTQEYQTESIASWAQAMGKATGIVTTSRVTHASPSGAYAHTANRAWEGDADVLEDNLDPEECMDIARQLVEQSPGKNIKVILGGGRSRFLTKLDTDPEYSNATGTRMDGRNLIKSWLKHKEKMGANASYVWNREDMLKANDSEYVLGLFERNHMLYHLEANPETEPTLAEMTKLAIDVLSKESKGYFLFVEGAKIDMAHHESYAKISFDETVEFAKAVTKAVEMTSEEDTLIVVTSDHAHTMSFSGYPKRGSNILTNLLDSNIDGFPYSTISYANGPGYKTNSTDPTSRYNLAHDKKTMNDRYYRFPATLPIDYETHGGDDVAVFARGPWSHLFTGSYEQNYIPYAMSYAAKIGPATTNTSSAFRQGVNITLSCLLLMLSITYNLT